MVGLLLAGVQPSALLPVRWLTMLQQWRRSVCLHVRGMHPSHPKYHYVKHDGAAAMCLHTSGEGRHLFCTNHFIIIKLSNWMGADGRAENDRKFVSKSFQFATFQCHGLCGERLNMSKTRIQYHFSGHWKLDKVRKSGRKKKKLGEHDMFTLHCGKYLYDLVHLFKCFVRSAAVACIAFPQLEWFACCFRLSFFCCCSVLFGCSHVRSKVISSNWNFCVMDRSLETTKHTHTHKTSMANISSFAFFVCQSWRCTRRRARSLVPNRVRAPHKRANGAGNSA